MPRPPSNPLRTAIVGAGLMGRWHADAIARTGGVVVAVVDPDLGAARRLAADRAGAQAAATLAPVLAEAAPDAVHVCSPVATHEQLVGEAIDAGKHVLVEKPLAGDEATTRALVERAGARKVLLCPVHQVLFQAGVRRVGERLDSLGPVRHLDATICTAGAAEVPPEGRDDVVAEILPHPLSVAARWLPGPLAEVAWQASRPAPGELRVAGASGGATVAIVVSTSGRPTAHRLRVIGERGTAHLDLFHGFAVIEGGEVSRARKIAHPFALAGRTLGAASRNLALRAVRGEPAYPGLRELVRAFHDAARGEAPRPITVREVLEVAAARDAILARPG